MVLGGIEDGDEDADNTLGFNPVGKSVAMRICEERSSEVADRSYNDGEVVPAVPETIVGGLVAEDLENLVSVKESSCTVDPVERKGCVLASDRRQWRD